MLRLRVPAVELDDGLAVGPVIAVAVGDEEQVRRGAHPHPAKAQLDPGEVGPLIVKDRPAIEPAVVIGVFEDQDPVLAARASQPDRVGVVLDDPEPPLVIDGHGDRLDDVGLGGEQADGETLGQRDPPDRFACGEGNIRRGVGVSGGRPGRGPARDWTPPAQAPRPDSIPSARHKQLRRNFMIDCSSTGRRQDIRTASHFMRLIVPKFEKKAGHGHSRIPWKNERCLASPAKIGGRSGQPGTIPVLAKDFSDTIAIELTLSAQGDAS